MSSSLPQGWEEKELIEFIDFNPKESIKKGTVSKSIPMACLSEYCKTISEYEEKEFKGGTKFRNGDTLLARITPCLENGKTAFVDFLDEKEVAFGSTEYIVLREKEKISDRHFIYYLSISPQFREIAIKSMTGSSGRQRVQNDVLFKEKFILPSDISEQKRIADILSAFDDKIELNNQMNQTLENIATALFIDSLSDKESFMETTLDDLVDIKYGKDHKHLDDGTMPLYGSGGIMRFVNDFLYDKESILIPRKGTLGNLFFIQKPFWTVDTIFYTEIDTTKVIPIYLYYLLKRFDLANLNVGSAVPSLTKQALNALKLEIPNIIVQKKVSDILASLHNKILGNIEENQTLKKQRDTLLPKLMSGEIRV